MDYTLSLAVSAGSTTDVHAVLCWAHRLERLNGRWLLIGDDFVSGLDALQLAMWLAPQTSRIGLVPEVPVTHNEPFHLASATATLDWDSQGRGAWSPTVQTSDAAAERIGRRPAADPEPAWQEAKQVAEALRRLWTSWEPDAEIRDAATGRFLDAEKVHYVDFEGKDSVGTPFSIKGPSIVPRPPQGVLPAVVTVEDEPSAQAALAFAEVAIAKESGLELLDALVAERRTGPSEVLLRVTGFPEGDLSPLEDRLERARSRFPGLGIAGVVVQVSRSDACPAADTDVDAGAASTGAE